MGPRLFRRGNQGPAVRPHRNPSSFNGATPFQTWKHRSRGGGERGAKCFNGATPFQTWKRNPKMPDRPAHTRLQWGHAFSDVETCIISLVPGVAQVASMGPRLFRRGNAVGRRGVIGRSHDASMGPRLFRRGNDYHEEDLISYKRLQWGHAFSDVETRTPTRTRRRLPRCFNGATPFQTWKRCRRAYPSRRVGFASMGPRLFRRGNRFRSWLLMARLSRFNGATPFQTWKH